MTRHPAASNRARLAASRSTVRASLAAHQSALVGMTQLLESMTEAKAEALLGRSKRIVTGFDGVVDVAMERVEQFLDQQSATANAELLKAYPALIEPRKP